MRIFTDNDTLPEFRNPVVTVGSFDGVHTGHAHLLGIMKQRAAETGGETVVVTFAEHPRHVLQAEDDIKLLTSLKEKALLLDGQGVDNLYIMPFDQSVSRLSPEQFLRDFLIGKLGAKQLVVGYNHHFGHNKEGNTAMLRELESKYGFCIHEARQFRSGDDKISSTVIREAVLSGDMSTAERLLGHPYIIMARVGQDGALALDEPLKLLPPAGSYDVFVNGSKEVLAVGEKGTLTIETLPKFLIDEELLISFLNEEIHNS
jgi:riboflavin kinase/FMN adenylyltransferase